MLLAAGELIRIVVLAPFEPEHFEQLLGALLAMEVALRVKERQLDVLDGAGSREQIEGLENEANSTAADRRQLFFFERGDIDAFEQVTATGGTIEASDDVHQSRLARTRRAHDCEELAALDAKRDVPQGLHFDFAHTVGLVQAFDLDNRRHRDAQCASRSGDDEAASDAVGLVSPERNSAVTTKSPCLSSPLMTST